jgi:predicted Holliday junction resolvase-like endonuclease
MQEPSAYTLLAVVVAIVFLLLYFGALRRERELRVEQGEQRKRIDLATQRERELRDRVGVLANEQLDQWKRTELATLKAQEQEIARREAHAMLQEWKGQNEAAIRQDAIQRSRAVIAGQVSEHLLPFMPVFPYNPKDAKFIGSPIDLIVFDGLQEDSVRRVIFLEVKIGASGLSPRQRQLRDVIRAGRVEWQELRPDAIPTG